MTLSREEIIYSNQRRLRGALLDTKTATSYPLARDLASELLLYLDDSKACWMLAADRLRTILAVERVDGGFATPQEQRYHPGQSESLSDLEEIPSLSGIIVSNAEDGMRQLWNSPKPVVFRSIREERAFGTRLRSDLVRAGVGTKMAYALHDETGPFALLCADRVKRGEPEWATWQYDLFEDISKLFLGPILGAARSIGEQAAPPDLTALHSLSKAERKIAELVSRGMSYKEIARTTGRSVFTVDHHLRNIRAKLGIVSHAKLASFLNARFLGNGPGPANAPH
jgi:DNA-binding CsgD family transcriptional regulator